MARRPKSRRKSRAGGAQPGRTARGAADPRAPERVRDRLQIALLAIAAAGVALTAYLTALRWLGAHPLACGPDSPCDLVQSSRWSTLLGVPVALWGLLTYAAIGGLVWNAHRRRTRRRHAWLVAGLGLAVSVYLTAVSVLVIEAVCAWCLASLGLVTALFAGLSWRLPERSPGFAWRSQGGAAAGAALLLVGAMHLHWSGVFDPAAGPEKPYLRALAEHLTESGARFYGAYWCPHCQDQKDLFEASAHRLPYVECTPEGRNGPVAAACALNDIGNYPTWVIGERRLTGVLQPETLARLSDFRAEGIEGVRPH